MLGYIGNIGNFPLSTTGESYITSVNCLLDWSLILLNDFIGILDVLNGIITRLGGIRIRRYFDFLSDFVDSWCQESGVRKIGVLGEERSEPNSNFRAKIFPIRTSGTSRPTRGRRCTAPSATAEPSWRSARPDCGQSGANWWAIPAGWNNRELLPIWIETKVDHWNNIHQFCPDN